MQEFNEKQIEILKVAEQLFAEEGFDGTSIREISKRANINIAMISYYFGSKEKLLESIVLHRISGMRLQLENLYHEDISPIAKIDKLIELYIQRIYSNRCIYQILHFELSNKKRDINLEVFTEVKNENLEVIRNIITQGQEKGFFQPNIEVALLSSTIMGTLTHFNMNQSYFERILNLKTEEEFENYILTTFTKHIQKQSKAY